VGVVGVSVGVNVVGEVGAMVGVEVGSAVMAGADSDKEAALRREGEREMVAIRRRMIQYFYFK
jgi:hypothetical protein